MKRAFRYVASLVVVVSTLQAASAQTADGGDLARLQGKWTAFLAMPRGPMRVVVEFKGNRVYTTMGRGPSTKPDTVAEVVLDETKSPKQMVLRNGQNIGAEPGSLQSRIQLPDIQAIYELDGDTWTTCTNILAKALPTKLATGKGLVLSVYKRGELEMPKGSAGRGAAVVDDRKTKVLKSVTVSKPQRTTATLVTADGESIEVITNHAKKAHDLDGKPATQFRNFFHEGNVLDVTLAYVGPKRPIWEIREMRMIRGVFKAPEAIGPRGAGPSAAAAVPKPKAKPVLRPEQVLRRATVGKAFKDHYQLFIDGEEFKIYADNPHAMSFDASGKQIARQSASKLLKEGNVVDVGFFGKHPSHPYYMLSEIHLIQGEIR
jgi:uncharacterized protein (TIGR03067 family)